MAYILNDKLKELEPYEVKRGRKAIFLDANESYLPVHPDIKRSILSQIRKLEFNRYPDPLAKKCCKAFGDYYGVDPALVTAGNGSDELISVILGGFFSKGDKILLTEPDFSMYGIYAKISELETIRYLKDDDYRVNPAELVALAKREACKGLILSNPCNPTSQGLRKMPLRSIISGLPDTLVVVDEAYMDFWNQSLLNEVAGFENLIVLRTASKALGSASIRLGFAVANKKLTKAIRSVKSPYNVSATTQAAGIGLLKHGDLLQNALLDILAGRGYLSGALLKLEAEWRGGPNAFRLVPESKTNFVVLRFEDKSRHGRIYEYLRKRGIIIRCFPDFLRVTVGGNDENQAFLGALSEFGAEGRDV